MKKIKKKIKKKISKILDNGFKRLLKLLHIKLIKIRDNDLSLYIELYGEESVKKRRFYNISVGSYLGFGGGLHHPCWTKIDVNPPKSNKRIYSDRGLAYDPKFDIEHDLLSLKALPVESSIAELVHTRFTIASINDEAAQLMFNEVFRILKPNGIFRISTPNIDLDYRAYMSNDMSFFYWFANKKAVSIEQAFLIHVAAQASPWHQEGAAQRINDEQFRNLILTKTKEDALNYCTSLCSIETQKKYRQDHINWWNQDKLEKMLKKAGFKTIYLSSREQSASPVMRNPVYFDNYDNKFVMYMEAAK